MVKIICLIIIGICTAFNIGTTIFLWHADKKKDLELKEDNDEH